MQTRRLHTTSSYLVGANGRIHFGSPPASSDRCGPASSDRHTPGHLRMKRAEVLVGAWRIEREGELLVGIDYRRFEFLVAAHDHVGDVVAIRPPHAASYLYRRGRGCETEVVDGNLLHAGSRRL